jgi:uncharacterized protein (TIGR02145 family)
MKNLNQRPALDSRFSEGHAAHSPRIRSESILSMIFLIACLPVASSAAGTGDAVKDADGNLYRTVKIGRQVWTVENLRTTRFNDGTLIPQISDNQEWKDARSPAFCLYENKPENKEPAGLLYNWHAASSPKIAPAGWRVPTLKEQLELRDYLVAMGYNYDGTKEGNKVAKAMSTKTGWPLKSADAYGNPLPEPDGMVGYKPESNNRSGFSARPAGSRWYDGSFHARETSVYWWSVTTFDEGDGCHTSIHTWFSKFGDNHHSKQSGFSIRLIRDEASGPKTRG